MRLIRKQPGQPSCIEDFVKAQTEARLQPGGSWEQFPIDYGHFTRGKALLQLLVTEQAGLCAYTGAAIDDERLAKRQPRQQTQPRKDYWFKPHIEHLKSQRQCKDELEADGGIVGRDRGEDMDYQNLVAAMEVAGARAEHFGAALRGDEPVAVWPTHPDCETAFHYFLDGSIRGHTQEGSQTIEVLQLDHPTLRAWRSNEIDEWFRLTSADAAVSGTLTLPEDLPEEELMVIIEHMTTPQNDSLPEFAFVIAQIARDSLAIKQRRSASATSSADTSATGC